MSRKIIIPRGLVEDPNQSSVIEVSPRLNQTTGNLIARRQGGRLVAQQLPDWQDSYSNHRGLENTFVATPLGCRPDQTPTIPNPNVTFDVSRNLFGNTTDNFNADSSDPSIQHSLACYNTPMSETPSRAEFNVTSDELNLSSISESNIEMNDVMVASILNKTRQNLYQPRGNMDDVRKRLFTDSDGVQQQSSRERSRSSRGRPPGDKKDCSCSQEDSMYGDFQPLASSSGIDLTRSYDQTMARSSNQTRTGQPGANQSYGIPQPGNLTQSPRSSNQTYTVQAPGNVTRTIQPGRNQTYTMQGDLSRAATLHTNQTYTCPGNRTRTEPGRDKTYTVQQPGNISKTEHTAADYSYGIPLPGNVFPPATPHSNQTYTLEQTPRIPQPGRNQTYTIQTDLSRSDTFPSNQTYICPGNRTRPEPKKNKTYTVQQPGNVTRTTYSAADQSYGIPLPGNVFPPVTPRSNQTYTVQQTAGNITRTTQPAGNQTYTVQENSSRSATFPSNQTRTSGMNQTFDVSSSRRYQPSVIQTLPRSLPRCARPGLGHDDSIQDSSNNITDLPTDDSYDFNFRPQFASSQRSYSTLYDSSEVSFDRIDGSFPHPNASPCPCTSGEQEAPPRQHRTYTVQTDMTGRSRRLPPGHDSSFRTTNQTGRRADQSFDKTFNPPLSSTQRLTMSDSSERGRRDVSPCSCGVNQPTGRRSQNRRQDTYSIPPNRSGGELTNQFSSRSMSSMEDSSDRQTSRVDECGCSQPGADSIVSYSSHVVEDVHEED